MRAKYSVTTVVIFAITAVGSFWLSAQQSDTRPLAEISPPGALIYLEAKDFHKLVGNWNLSNEKKLWLKSANHSSLGESRLLQRLEEAQTEFASVAGFPVAMNMVNEFAGSQSSLALYDLSKLTFVYVTRLEESRINTSRLWKSRSGYETRQVAGIPFYTKTETSEHSSRTVAFASYHDWFVMTTDADKMARCLTLLAGEPGPSLANQPWFESAIKPVLQQGDLRLVYNLNALQKTAQFRTYWIQRNESELKAYSSGTADLFDLENGFEERRTLLSQSSGASPASSEGLAEALSYTIPNASVYRAWANPDQETLRSVLSQVILSDAPQHTSLNRIAPEVNTEAEITGSTSDLETRIDEPEFRQAKQNSLDEVLKAVLAMKPVGILHSQATALQSDQVFLVPQSEAVVVCGQPDLSALQKALAGSVSLVKTASLDQLRVSVSGQALLISRLAHIKHLNRVRSSWQVYAAGYNNAEEWPRYKSIFGLIERNAANPETPVSANTLPFFHQSGKLTPPMPPPVAGCQLSLNKTESNPRHCSL